MKKILCLMILTMVFLTGCNIQWKKEPKKFNIVSSIYSLSDVAGNLGGGWVKSDYIIPPGVSEHSYEPKPNDVIKLAEADLVFVVGGGLDNWVLKMAKSSGISEDKIVDLSKFVLLKKSTQGDEAGSDDPHYWLSPKRMIEVIDDMQKSMAEKDSVHAADYAKNLEDYTQELVLLDKEYTEKINGFVGKDIVTFHNAFSYLADDYGLKVIGVIEPVAGNEPTPQQLQEIEEQLKAMQYKAVFAEPQLSSKVTESIGKDLGIQIGILDPLGGVEGRMTYVGLAKYNLLELARFLAENKGIY